MPTVLAVSQDDTLLATRSGVLRRTDAEVVSARADEAIELLKMHQFDFVLLCHSLSVEELDALES